MKDVNRKHLMDLINDGLDYEDIIDAVERMQCEEDEEDNNQAELEQSMEEASYALADFFFKGLSMYGLTENGMKESDLQDSIMESLKEMVSHLQRAGELKKNLSKLNEQVNSKNEPTEEDLKKLLDALFK